MRLYAVQMSSQADIHALRGGDGDGDGDGDGGQVMHLQEYSIVLGVRCDVRTVAAGGCVEVIRLWAARLKVWRKKVLGPRRQISRCGSLFPGRQGRMQLTR